MDSNGEFEEYFDINHGPKSQKPVAAVQKRSGNWQLVGWRGHVGTPDGAKKCLVLQCFATSGGFCRMRVQVRKCYKHLEIIGNLIWEQRLPNTFYRWPQSIPTKHLDSHSQVRLLKGIVLFRNFWYLLCLSHRPVRQGSSVQRTELLTTRIWVKWSTFPAGWVLKLGHVWTLEAARSHELMIFFA